MLVCLAATLLQAVPTVQACTTFSFIEDGRTVFGRNYDFEFGEAWVVVNPRKLQRVATVQGAARWQSRFGSITFNQYGVGFPTGGVNEVGLVVELMWLEETQYPAPDARPAVSTLEFIQYLLDNAADVGEALNAADAVRIAGRTPIHFLLADAKGDRVTIEFLGGKRVSTRHTRAQQVALVLANDTHAASLQYSKAFSGFGGQQPVPGSMSSLDRFVRASALLQSRKDANAARAVPASFAVLDAVAQGKATHWQIVYDLGSKTIHYRTQANRNERQIKLSDFDYTCKPQAPGVQSLRWLNVDHGGGSVAGQFAAYDARQHVQLVTEAYAKTSFLKQVPADAVRQVAVRHEQQLCAE